jgi:dihydroorotate dehydrogenase (NAD+) catalytic subunit
VCKENSTKAGISVGKVTSLKEVKPGIYHLVLKTNLVHQDFSIPQSGQFYMLRSTTSKVLLSRPISVFSSRTEDNFVFVEFLILLKGQGTKELCNLSIGDSVDMTGPLGNTFPLPEENLQTSSENPKIAIVGGGIGVAPVAGFSKNLAPQSYDFYS